ncbi:TonB-dependent siderophore receptor [Thauera phenylacetica B4P]|uniref:TonB-dependent siderophore receptor n=1 Tax=Thauera phenylacetica B4P TaxID=1234382 RepID=N6Z586_9RHOO|nr:TonB-dependent receptor [Thauera phenylacetica]ENO99040.1 TonB-dependent siderophore receptor [Thauera phenylacetica B4P]
MTNRAIHARRRAATPQATHSTHLRPTPLVVALHLALMGGTLMASGWSTVAHAQGSGTAASSAEAAPKRYDIPAGPVGTVVARFAGASGVLLAGASELVQGRNSPGLSGTYTLDAAIKALLAGSGLDAVRQANGSYALRQAAPAAVPTPASPAHTAAEAVLPVVTVRAGADTTRTGLAAEGYWVTSSGVAGFTERPIKDTPFSVKSVSSELMLNRGVGDLGKLDQIDASVSNSYSNWYPGQFIRGFSLVNDTNYRRNGLAFQQPYTVGLENKERVDVLKGLSGLQAGFSSPGGVINYVIKRPEDISELHLTVNQFGNAKMHVDVGRMLTDDVGVRLNAAVEDERNQIDHVHGPRSFVSGAVAWKITPNTSFDFDIEHEQRKKTFQPNLTLNTDGKIPAMPSPSTFLGQQWASFNVDSTAMSGKLEHRFSSDWSSSLAIGHHILKRDNTWLGFDSIAPNGDADVNLWHSPNDKGEATGVRFATNGKFATAGLQHDLAFGYEHTRVKFAWNAAWVSAFGSTNIYNPVALVRPSGTYDSGGDTDLRRDGFFINDVVALGEKWDIHLGGRYGVVEDQASYADSAYEKTAFTPTVALVFKPRPDLSAYVSYTEGLETGGTAPTGTTNVNQIMPPLVSKQVEAGLKGEIGQLAWETSIFRISRPAEYTNGANTYVQTGEQLHQGLEFSVSGKVTREVTLFGGAMWLDAKLKETGDPATAGKRPTGAANQRVALTAEYAPAALSGWTFAANLTHTGSRAVDAANTAIAPGYELFGLGLRHQRKIAGKDVTFRLNVDNLFNKRYWAKVDNDALEVGVPRTVWGGLSVAF